MKPIQSTVVGSSNFTDKTWIPKGFVSLTGPDNKQYLVPDFMVPSLQQHILSKVKKNKLGAYNSLGMVSDFPIGS